MAGMQSQNHFTNRHYERFFSSSGFKVHLRIYAHLVLNGLNWYKEDSHEIPGITENALHKITRFREAKSWDYSIFS